MGLGLLPEEFPEPAIHVWDLEDGVAHFTNGIEVPIKPFPGTIGVAPAADGEHSTNPPRSVGGNLDIKHLTAGSTLHLPVAVENALFSIGDCHAAQATARSVSTASRHRCPSLVASACSQIARSSDPSLKRPSQVAATNPCTARRESIRISMKRRNRPFEGWSIISTASAASRAKKHISCAQSLSI